MASKQAYKNKVELSFIGSTRVNIESSKIVYILIEHIYDTNVMPIIYLSVSVNLELKNMIINEKDSARIYLNIQKYDIYSDTALPKNYICDNFRYRLASTTPEYTKDLADFNSNVDSNYTTITIGLIDINISNTLRRTFGGGNPVKKINQHDLVYKAIEDTRIVLKPPTYNNEYDNLYIPPITTRKNMLQFIFELDPFYDTNFLYFVDFDHSYLLDRTGEAISAGDGQLDDVYIDIRSVIAAEAYNEGMDIRNGAYYFFVNPANTRVSMNIGNDKVSNQLITTFTGTDSKMMDLNINNGEGESVKQVFKRLKESSAIVYKNTMESANVCIEFIKDNIDARYITPNKAYMVRNYEGYDDYNGRYTLMYKKEVIHGASQNFASVVTVGIKKVSNIRHIGSASSSSSQGLTASTRTSARGSVTNATVSKVNYSRAVSDINNNRVTRTSSKK